MEKKAIAVANCSTKKACVAEMLKVVTKNGNHS